MSNPPNKAAYSNSDHIIFSQLDLARMKYFHINTEATHSKRWRRMQVGTEIIIGQDINPIYTNWIKSVTRIGTGVTKEDVEKSYIVMLRESVFENMRLRNFPHLPSRTNCLWLCDTESSVHYWKSRIPQKGKKRIFEVRIINGKIHKAYEEHLTNDKNNISELEEKAWNYWSGKGSGEYEFLFSGTLLIENETLT